MTSLHGVSLFIVCSNAAERERLAAPLEADGARVRGADSASDAWELLRAGPPDVLITETDLPDYPGTWLGDRLRREFPVSEVPVIAITGRHSSSLTGYAKCLSRPIKSSDLVAAVASLYQAKREEAVQVLPAAAASKFDLLPHLERRLSGNDVRGVLGLLNATAGFRFTSMFRFDGENLTSVWTFDRDNPTTDTFPTDATVGGSYCSFVRDSKAAFVVQDAATDARVAAHPKRLELLAYCGVPLYREDGAMYGTLCHFDSSNRIVSSTTVEWLQTVAKMLRPKLST